MHQGKACLCNWELHPVCSLNAVQLARTTFAILQDVQPKTLTSVFRAGEPLSVLDNRMCLCV